MLRTPLHQWHTDHGGRMVEFAGWEMPIQYSSIVAEHQAVRQEVGLFDISHMGRFWFTGKDAVPFLDHILTNHVAQLKPGQVRYSLVCNQGGGILDDVLIYRFDNEYLLVVNGANREKIADWIQQQTGDFEFEMEDRTQDSVMVALQGPHAAQTLASLTSYPLPDLKYYFATKTEVDGISVVLSRTGYTGEDGFELIADADHGLALWEKLLEAGGERILPCGLGCRDTLRLEAGMPLYGHEMDESVDPFTAGLGFGVRMSKADFIGKSALETFQANPPRTKRVGLKLTGKRIAREGAQIFHNTPPEALTSSAVAPEIGVITSGTFSPTIDAPIAMARVDAAWAQVDTPVEVDIRGKRNPAVIVELPFYKRK